MTRKFLDGFGILILAQLMVSINIVGSKYLLPTIPILLLLTLRFLLSACLLLPLHWVTKKNSGYQDLKTLNKKDWLFILAQALSAGVFFNGLMLLGLNYTSANAAGIITSALPAIIAVMSFLILKEYFSKRKSLCVGLATFGLLITSFDQFFGVQVNHSLSGDFLIFLSLIPEASYYILSKLHPNRLPIFLISGLVNTINAIVLLPLVIFFVSLDAVQISAFGSMILIIVCMTSGLFYVFWYLGSHTVDGIMASLSTAIMPVITVIIAWITLGEVINTAQFIGMFFVISSIVLYSLPQNFRFKKLRE